MLVKRFFKIIKPREHLQFEHTFLKFRRLQTDRKKNISFIKHIEY